MEKNRQNKCFQFLFSGAKVAANIWLITMVFWVVAYGVARGF